MPGHIADQVQPCFCTLRPLRCCVLVLPSATLRTNHKYAKCGRDDDTEPRAEPEPEVEVDEFPFGSRVQEWLPEEIEGRLYKELVGESEEWINNIGPKVAKLIDRNSMVIHNLYSTDLSIIK